MSFSIHVALYLPIWHPTCVHNGTVAAQKARKDTTLFQCTTLYQDPSSYYGNHLQ
jgi:hypothetical protein